MSEHEELLAALAAVTEAIKKLSEDLAKKYPAPTYIFQPRPYEPPRWPGYTWMSGTYKYDPNGDGNWVTVTPADHQGETPSQ